MAVAGDGDRAEGGVEDGAVTGYEIDYLTGALFALVMFWAIASWGD